MLYQWETVTFVMGTGRAKIYFLQCMFLVSGKNIHSLKLKI